MRDLSFERARRDRKDAKLTYLKIVKNKPD